MTLGQMLTTPQVVAVLVAVAVVVFVVAYAIGRARGVRSAEDGVDPNDPSLFGASKNTSLFGSHVPVQSTERQLVAVMPEALIVVDSLATVRYASSEARRFGIIHDQVMTFAELRDIVKLVSADGMVRERELTIPLHGRAHAGVPDTRGRGVEAGKPLPEDTLYLHVRVGQIADGLFAVFISDMSEQRRFEAMRRDFVTNVSHELKTPLAGIRLLSDSILQTENMDAQTVREFVGDIEQESERLARITENLLRLTRLDSGMLPEAQRVDLSPVMARVVRMLRLVAEEKQVDLSYEIRREGQTLASEDEIHEIIYNLTENAIKYNRPGGFVKLLLAGDEKDCLLTVSDNGIGIPEGDMPRIFDRFYRVDKMRSRAAGGTGLGLSIAADTARRRGGSIEVRAREGGGTVFTVRLPRCEEGGDET